MAVARPVRFLGAVSIVLILFLIYQTYQPAAPLQIPTHDAERINNWEKDPLLDRELFDL